MKKNKIRNLILSLTIAFSFLGLSYQINATEDQGVWVRIDQVFAEGAWQVLEQCQEIGLGCTFGEYRAVTVNPQQQ